jgi:single-stranded-DNA-specific exonuclease
VNYAVKENSMNIPASLARVLDSRGIVGEARTKYLAPADFSQIERPQNLPGLETVVARLMGAIQSNQAIGIYADYDCDGVLSGAILYTALKMLGADVCVVLPTRDEGYGLTSAAVKQFAATKKRLLVTVDNGINAHEQIKLADELGLDTVVIDHHQRNGDDPAAAAILWDERYCAAALAFMVAWGLFIELRGEEKAEKTAKSLVRLAAIAMIADCVPLTGEARELTKFGLQSLAEAAHPGLREILRLGGVRPGIVPSTRQVGYSISPMLNSAGRIGDPADALDALLESDPKQAIAKAGALSDMNKRRRDLQNELWADVLKSVKRVGPVCVAYKNNWPRGLVGIMAARAVDHFGVPAFVLGLDTRTGRAFGSARSVPGFHLVEAMNSCSGLLAKFGGHAAAAGITIEPDKIDAFREAICDYAKKANIVKPTFEPEAELHIADVGGDFYNSLKLMEPFGIGNDHPRFLVKGVQLIKHKSYASLLRNGKREIEVRHPEDASLVYSKSPHDYLVEATPTHIYLRGVAA